jgi:hypothetical protein
MAIDQDIIIRKGMVNIFVNWFVDDTDKTRVKQNSVCLCLVADKNFSLGFFMATITHRLRCRLFTATKKCFF